MVARLELGVGHDEREVEVVRERTDLGRLVVRHETGRGQRERSLDASVAHERGRRRELGAASERHVGSGFERTARQSRDDREYRVADVPDRLDGVATSVALREAAGRQRLADDLALERHRIVRERRGDARAFAERREDAQRGRRSAGYRLADDQFVVGERRPELAGRLEGLAGAWDRFGFSDILARIFCQLDGRRGSRAGETRIEDQRLEAPALADRPRHDRGRRTAGGADGHDRGADRPAVFQYLGVRTRRVGQERPVRTCRADPLDLGGSGGSGDENEPHD
jgi:hypothetical protein